MQHEYDAQCVSGDSGCSPRGRDVKYGRSGGGVTAGVVLIVIGVALLVGQMIPGFDWWTLWPLVIVVAGLAQVVTPWPWGSSGAERVADGIGTVLVGLLLLGNTTGYVSWQVWMTLLTLWPVLLISAGLGLLAKASGQDWLRAAASIPIWVTLLYAAGLWWTGAPLPLELPPLPSSMFTLPFTQIP